MRLPLSILTCAIALTGCGSHSVDCSPAAFTLSATPAIGQAGEPNHTAPPPRNQEQFAAFATSSATGPGCALPQSIAKVPATWTVSDTADVSISSSNDASNGLATCLHATPKTVTVTASYGQNGMTQTASATISCR